MFRFYANILFALPSRVTISFLLFILKNNSVKLFFIKRNERDSTETNKIYTLRGKLRTTKSRNNFFLLIEYQFVLKCHRGNKIRNGRRKNKLLSIFFLRRAPTPYDVDLINIYQFFDSV